MLADGSAPDVKTARKDIFRSRLVVMFYVVLAINLTHRLVALRYYYEYSFKPIYGPRNRSEGAEMLWAAHGDSLLSGIGNDVIFSLLIAAVLALPIAGRWLRVAATAGFLLFLGANLEHIKYNFTHINLATTHIAMDMTFIKGQLTSSFGNAVIQLTVIAAIIFGLLQVRNLRRLGTILLLPVLLVPLLFAGTFSYSAPVWMQTHPLLPTLSRNSPASNPRNFSASAFDTFKPVLPAETGYNILLVYLESVSEKSLELGDMDALVRLSEENISFRRYVSNQIVTANGLYSTLTGDFPYLISKKFKWEELKSSDEIARKALPAQLRLAGYHTAFLQSADLDFMNKGDILPRIGFSEVRGRKSWDSYYASDGWGIDDLALFEHTLDYVEGLDAQSPWFVSVLTTGTHSPYNVPPDFMPEETSDRTRALAYLDMAIEKLLDGLRERGLLEKTVVIFTADESRERSFEHPLQDQIMLNWLPLVILHPTDLTTRFDFFIGSHRLPEIVSAVSGPTDVAKLAALEHPQVPLIFGNAWSNQLFWFDSLEKTLLSCETTTFICAVFEDVADPITMAADTPTEVSYFPDLERLILKREPED